MEKYTCVFKLCFMSSLFFIYYIGFPNVVRVVDGTQIPIKGPSQNEADFVNRKGFHSVNVQMVCDARFKVTKCGSQIVSLIAGYLETRNCAENLRMNYLQYNNYQILKSIKGEIDGLLLGDSGYACRPFLMTPYLNSQTHARGRYNAALTRTRVIIEHTFGVLKRRFPCQAIGLRMKTSNTPLVIVSCVVLHNFGMKSGDTFERTVSLDLDLPPVEHADGENDQAGARCRDAIVARYFA